MAFGGIHPFMLKKAAAGGGGSPDGGEGGGDVVTKSLRFNPGDISHLIKTFSSSSTTDNGKRWTLSMWVKQSDIDEEKSLFQIKQYPDYFLVKLSGGIISVLDRYSSQISITGVPKLRDPAAFYHIIIVYDSPNTSATERMQIWVNGERQSVTSVGTIPQDRVSRMFTAEIHRLGVLNNSNDGDTTYPFGGLMSDIYGVDGLALTPTSFAEEDATTGEWKPIAYSGAMGDNGFHLDFEDDTAIGNDVSGNDNDFTATNLAASDVLEDTPTDNYCVYNEIFSGASGLSEGNLKCTTTARGTFDAMSFASYWEIEANTTSVVGGVISEGGTANTVAVTNGSTFGFRLSAAGALEYTTNGSSWTSIGGTLSGEQFPYVTGGTTTANFGQSTLSYSVPSGYAVLSTAGMTATIAKPSDHMNTLAYASSGAKTGVGFQPDLVWVKARANTYDHELTDSVRGVTKALSSNDTGVESTDSTGVTAFDSDGFTVGAGTNYSTSAMAAWCFKKSATAGFNIVGWTGTDTGMGSPSPQAITHGLGVTPELIIAKNRTANSGSSTGDWAVWTKDLTAGTYLKLNSTDGEGSWSTALFSSIGAATASVSADAFGSGIDLNYADNTGGYAPDDTYIGYFIASVAGYSKVGSINSSSSSAFVYTGFRPTFILAKRSDATGGNWMMFDDQREGYNVDNDDLMANSSAIEATTDHIDILSNGFKIRTSDADLNAGTVIYYAVGQSSKYANAR